MYYQKEKETEKEKGMFTYYLATVLRDVQYAASLSCCLLIMKKGGVYYYIDLFSGTFKLCLRIIEVILTICVTTFFHLKK